MHLTFHPNEEKFAENLHGLRDMGRYINLNLNVIRNGRGCYAVSARVMNTPGFGGEIGFGYTGTHGEIRCLLSEIE